MDKTKRKNILKLCFKLTFTIAALWLVYTKVDFNAFNRIWDQANPWFFIPALLCFTFSQLISSFRLLYFFKNIQLPITVLYNLRLYLQGMFYNIFLPGGVGGDGYKIVILSKQFRNNSRSVFTAIFLDRVSGAWALSFCIIVFGTLVEAAPGFRTIVITAYIAATVLYYFIIRFFFNKHIKRFAVVHGLALLVQVFQTSCVFFILMALGHEGDKLPYIFIFLLSSFAILFPFTIGGLGAREIAMVWGASALLLDKDISVSVSLCFYIIAALFSLSGSIFIFSKHPARPPLTENKTEVDASLELMR